MLELEITFLTGRYVATGEANRDEAEWPPHPARVFSALVSNWAEVETPDENEREVLEWLEHLPAPEIVASDAVERTPVIHYVPGNDATVVGLAETDRRARALDRLSAERDLALAAGQRSEQELASIDEKVRAQLDVSAKVATAGKTNPADATELLPSGRNRQARMWPSMRPLDPTVVLRWPRISVSSRTVDILDALCARVSRLGHSTSLVSVRALTSDAKGDVSHWVPDAAGDHNFRWVQQGQLRALESAHAIHGGNRPRSLPKLGVTYRDTTTSGPSQVSPTTSNLSGELFVFALPPNHRRLPAVRTAELCGLLRRALISKAPEPVHAVISGHGPTGEPLRSPHIATLALPFVADRRATGLILGLAVLLPSELSGDSRAEVLRALSRWDDDGARLNLGNRGVVQLERAGHDPGLASLRRSTWAHRSRRWVSATPIALPRHPGDLRRGTASSRERAWQKARAAVILACAHCGLPEPSRVEVSLAPLLRGAERVGRYKTFQQGGQARSLLHTALTFREPIAGPLVLGSGRFVGLGLMRPVEDALKSS